MYFQKILMIILNNKVYSIEMWEWFNQMENEILDFEKNRDSRINVFIPIFYEEHREEWPKDYYKLDCGQFWEILWDIFRLICGISGERIETKYSIDDIELEIDKIYRTMIWWCFAEGLTEDDYGKVDYTMKDDVNKSMNQHFRYKIYYIYKEIEERLIILKKLFKNFKNNSLYKMQIIDEYKARSEDVNETKDFIKNEITKNAAGDLDEFILYTISDFQNGIMTENHEKLAKLIRFQKFDDSDFESKLPKGQIWQSIFTDEFEGKDDVFGVFYENYTEVSIKYFLKDFAVSTFDIIQIPFYGVFTDDNGISYAEDIHFLLDIKKIKNRIKKVLKKYEFS